MAKEKKEIAEIAAGMGKTLLKSARLAGRAAIKTAGAAGNLLYKGAVKGIDKLGGMDRKNLWKLGGAAACAVALPVFILAPGRADRRQELRTSRAPFQRQISPRKLAQGF